MAERGENEVNGEESDNNNINERSVTSLGHDNTTKPVPEEIRRQIAAEVGKAFEINIPFLLAEMQNSLGIMMEEKLKKNETRESENDTKTLYAYIFYGLQTTAVQWRDRSFKKSKVDNSHGDYF